MEEVRSKDGTTVAFDRLGDGRVLEGQEHVVPPELLAPVLAEFFAE